MKTTMMSRQLLVAALALACCLALALQLARADDDAEEAGLSSTQDEDTGDGSRSDFNGGDDYDGDDGGSRSDLYGSEDDEYDGSRSDLDAAADGDDDDGDSRSDLDADEGDSRSDLEADGGDSRSDLDTEGGESRSDLDAASESGKSRSDTEVVEQQAEETTEAPAEETTETPAEEAPTTTTTTDEQSATTSAPAAATSDSADSDLGSCGRVPVYEKPYGRSINRTEAELAQRESEGEKRILYGLDATVGEWPWVVKLRLKSEDGQSAQACTGTLLNDRWVITAAHCLNNAGEAEATVGLYDLVVPDSSSVTIKADKLIKHPEATATAHDLALIRLSEQVKFNDYVGPICRVPKSSQSLDSLRLGHKFCYTLGYGLNQDMGRPVKLQKLEIKTASCDKLEKEMDEKLSDVACILPRSADQGGTCRGDSGGPDLCYDEKLNRWFIFGVISFGPSDCNRDSSDPDDWLTASVDLTKYDDWVRETMDANND